MEGKGAPEGAGPGVPGAEIRTFLIADIRGYTLFTQERGDEVAAKLAAKFADIAREGVEARGGTLLELRGDEALCVFTSAREAIRAAVDLQERLVEETLSDPGLPLTVGIGLDAGEAVPVHGGYRGGALNLAARLCGRARAGEILASREVTHLARRIDGVRYEERGSLTFKGISDPVAVVRVVPEDADPAERLRPFTRSPTRPARSRRRSAIVAAGIVVAITVVAVGVPLLGRKEPVEVGANSLARLDAASARIASASPLGERPGAAVAGYGSVWVTQPDRGAVLRLDPEDGSVRDRISLEVPASGIAVADASVWVTTPATSSVQRINVELGEVTDTIPVGSAPTSIAAGGRALWIADPLGGALLRLDPVSGEVAEVPLPGQPAGVAFTPRGVWVSLTPTSVALVDPTSLTVTLTQPVGGGPTAILAAFGSIWVANHLDGTVSRLDPSTGSVRATIPVGEGPDGLVAAEGSVWVANGFEESVVAIDPQTDAVDSRVPVGGAAVSLTANGSELWLAVGASATEHMGGSLVMATGAELSTLDPSASDDTGWRILVSTNDGLLAYQKVGGPDGASLVPDLAAALPEVSPDGLSYRFVLRPGMRYSNGEPVRSEDFRRAIERALVIGQNPGLYAAIEGADACMGAGRCDLSDSIVTDDASVTFLLSTADPTLPFKLALPAAFPVPAGTPLEDQGLDALPATGPYMVGEASRGAVRLVRNPEFREWSGAAQPQGFLDEITFRFRVDPATAYDQLEAGALDVMLDTPTPDDLDALRATHPDRIASWPSANTLFVGLDVAKPPFDDERVRRALAFAIDRQHAVDLLGGPLSQRLTCQILPPTFQGYAPFCPFTLEPQSNAWKAPDLDRAQALIRRAGVAGEPVSVVTAGRPEIVDLMRYVADVLRDLGLRPHFEVMKDGAKYYFTRLLAPPGTPPHPHVFVNVWFSEYPGAGDFIAPQFSCSFPDTNLAGWCDEALDARMDQALALSLTDPGAANRAWTAIEHELVQAAVQVPVANLIYNHALSGRVGNVQIHPQWGLLPSRLWVE